MIVERTENEMILRLPLDIGTYYLEKITHYLKYIEANSESVYDETEINNIAEESKMRWWQENKHKFIK